MNNLPQSARSPTEAAFSLLLMLFAAMASCVAWKVSGTWAYLVAGFGFLVLAPLWYRLPVSFKSLRGPIGARLTPRREFTMIEKLCTLFGYGLLLVALGLRLFTEQERFPARLEPLIKSSDNLDRHCELPVSRAIPHADLEPSLRA